MPDDPQIPSIGMVVPSFNNMPYLRRTISSFYKYSPWLKFIVVDDASTEWNLDWRTHNPEADITLHRFEKNGGLTRSWNKGYQLAMSLDEVPEYLIFGNNDTLANNGWWRAMINSLNQGFSLAGPVSNAPGVTVKGGRQEVKRYVDKYKVTDEADYNNNVADILWQRFGRHGQTLSVPAVNGFFMMAKTATLTNHLHSPGNVFQPVVKFMPSGRRNNTPLMTGQEDELQARWNKYKLRSAVVLGSYIFHYRSVARGKQCVKGDWLRCDDFKKPV